VKRASKDSFQTICSPALAVIKFVVEKEERGVVRLLPHLVVGRDEANDEVDDEEAGQGEVELQRPQVVPLFAVLHVVEVVSI